ncbi:hypothetical protein KSP40_PGU017742 [Platanthera guangdongensis]|uniref:Uncharacterized protein n=1 Tax=Platanthera guangdongensis TaxID=2320717 RepID=A0ABR2MDT1_9ASPA
MLKENFQYLLAYCGFCCKWESATLFSLVFGGICYYGGQRFIGAINGVLVFGIIISFAALVGIACGDLSWSSLLRANFEAVPKSVPIISLAFVYQFSCFLVFFRAPWRGQRGIQAPRLCR